ncbi:TonB-dependent receptor [Flaviaesturariibacter terrae]
MKKTLLLPGFIATALSLHAQDTTRNGHQVNVTVSFQPVLREAGKINFSATPPAADTARPQLLYSIPNQNLVFRYQPGSLKPLALNVDSLVRWDGWNYVKLGYGTQQTPYLETGLSLGDPAKAGVNVYGNFYSSKGKLPFQELRRGRIDALGYSRIGSNHELTGAIGYSDDQYYRYGFPDSLSFPKDSLSAHYANVRARIGIRSLGPNAYGISYAPELRFNAFSDHRDNNETSTYLNLPLRKTIEGRFAFDLALEGSLTSFHGAAKNNSNSNWFAVSPSLQVKTAAFYLQAGLRPSWDNGAFKLMPNIMAEVGTADKTLAVIAGWTGRLRTNSFQYLTGYNPWIDAPLAISNSRIEEIYGGIKGTVSDHFSYLLRAGVNKYSNLPLFVNSGTGGKSFTVGYEPGMNSLNVHGELGYSVGERFSLRSVVDANHYTGVDVFEDAYGLPTFEWTTALRLQVLRDLYFKTDLYAFDGVTNRFGTESRKQNGAFDASAGLEFTVYKNLILWAQFNNLFNKTYQRWNQYPTYGFQFLGGIVFSFAQNKN